MKYLAVTALFAVVLLMLASSSTARPDPCKARSVQVGDRGRCVAQARWLMGGNKPQSLRGNRFFRLRVEPGIKYTRYVGQKAREMKFRLGYPRGKINSSFGPGPRGFLQGEVRPAFYRWLSARRQKRWEAARQKAKQTTALHWIYVSGGCYLGGPAAHRAGSHPPTNWQSDDAVDIGCVPYRSRVLSIASGTIGRVTFGSPCDGCNTGWHSFYLETRAGTWWYKHVRDLRVREGMRVRPGQWLANVAAGNGAVHVHLAKFGCSTTACILGGMRWSRSVQ